MNGLARFSDLLARSDSSLALATGALARTADDQGRASFSELAVAYREEFLKLQAHAKGEVPDSGSLSVDDARAITEVLRRRFPGIVGPRKDDICYATQNRQDAVKAMAARCDVVIVVGSPNSSNSNRLREVAANLGVPAYMLDDAADLRPEWIEGKKVVGVTAGASAPEVLVQAVIARLNSLGAGSVRELEGIAERVTFPLPKALVV